MPNHITNILSMKGPEDIVGKVRKAIASYNENSGEIFIDFQKILPLPKDLEGTTAPPRIVSEEEYQKMRKRIDAGDLTESECWGRISGWFVCDPIPPCQSLAKDSGCAKVGPVTAGSFPCGQD